MESGFQSAAAVKDPIAGAKNKTPALVVDRVRVIKLIASFAASCPYPLPQYSRFSLCLTLLNRDDNCIALIIAHDKSSHLPVPTI